MQDTEYHHDTPRLTFATTNRHGNLTTEPARVMSLSTLEALNNARITSAHTLEVAVTIQDELLVQREQLMASRARVGTIDGLVDGSRRVLRRMHKAQWRTKAIYAALALLIAGLIAVFVYILVQAQA